MGDVNKMGGTRGERVTSRPHDPDDRCTITGELILVIENLSVQLHLYFAWDCAPFCKRGYHTATIQSSKGAFTRFFYPGSPRLGYQDL